MKSLADRLGRDPSAEEHVVDLHDRIEALEERVKDLEDGTGANHRAGKKPVPKSM